MATSVVVVVVAFASHCPKTTQIEPNGTKVLLKMAGKRAEKQNKKCSTINPARSIINKDSAKATRSKAKSTARNEIKSGSAKATNIEAKSTL